MEKSHKTSVLGWSVIVVVVTSLIVYAVVWLLGNLRSLENYINNILCNNIALVIIILFLDTITNSNRGGRQKRAKRGRSSDTTS